MDPAVIITTAVCGTLLVLIPGLLLLKCRDRLSRLHKVLLSIFLALGTVYMFLIFWLSMT